MTYEAKLYLKTNKELDISLLNFSFYPNYIVFGNIDELREILDKNKRFIECYHLEAYYHNKLMDYYDLTKTKARVEIGSIIRSNVNLSDKAIVLMGAVINTNSSIGDNTMIDMNAVVGSGAIIKNNCHIGAGAVIAGILEPMSNIPVVIEDNVLIGANAVVLAGVHIGKNSIVGAGSVVTKDVIENTTVVGSPAREVNNNSKWEINHNLR